MALAAAVAARGTAITAASAVACNHRLRATTACVATTAAGSHHHLSTPPRLHPPTPRLAAQRDRPAEVLDVVKYVCRELWSELHQKPVDKLQTNNKGIFVLQDFSYRWTRYLSPPAGAGAGAPSSAELSLKYVLFPCGLIRGALAAFGLAAAVNADVSGTPRVIFHIVVDALQDAPPPGPPPGPPAAAPAT